MSDPTLSNSPAGYDAGDAPVTPAPRKAASRWEDFIDIFYAPSDVFARRENSGFGIPMLVVTLAVGLIFMATANAMAPIMDAEFAKASAKMGASGVSAEQMAAGRAMGEKFAKVMVFIATPIMIFVVGVLLWLSGKVVGARQTVNAAIMVVAYANVPRIIGGLLGGVQAMMMDPATLTSRYSISLSVARLLGDTTSPVVRALAGRLDLFTIWATVLLAIGLAVTGKIPRSKAAIAAIIVWVLSAVPDLLGALRQ